MGLLAEIKDFFAGFFTGGGVDMIKVDVKCDKCDDVISSVFRKSYDLQPTYGSESYDYAVNKQLVCPSCYQSISLKMELRSDFEILTTEINGGAVIKDQAQ